MAEATKPTSTTPAVLSEWAAELYADAPLVPRNMAKYRPYICPFHLLLDQFDRPKTVLDVGCGSGLLLGLLHKAGRLEKGIGFDSSHVAVEAGQKMAAKFAPETINIRYLDVGQPWPDGLFDVVSIIDVMHHVPPPVQKQVLLQAAAKVAPGGILLYKDMARRPVWRASMNRLHDLVMARQWIHYLPVKDAESWLAAERWKLPVSRDTSMLWYQHEMRVFSRD